MGITTSDPYTYEETLKVTLIRDRRMRAKYPGVFQRKGNDLKGSIQDSKNVHFLV